MMRKAEELTWKISDIEASDLTQRLQTELRQHVESQVGETGRQPFNIFVQDASDELLAGLRSIVHWNWLYITHVWVNAKLRSAGVGAELLKRAEEKARSLALKGIYLDTFDPKSRDFYLRNDFKEFAHLNDFPPGHTRTFLFKELT